MPKTTPQSRRVSSQKTAEVGHLDCAIAISKTATLARTNLTESDRKEIEAKGGQITTLAEFLRLGDFEIKTIDLQDRPDQRHHPASSRCQDDASRPRQEARRVAPSDRRN